MHQPRPMHRKMHNAFVAKQISRVLHTPMNSACIFALTILGYNKKAIHIIWWNLLGSFSITYFKWNCNRNLCIIKKCHVFDIHPSTAFSVLELFGWPHRVARCFLYKNPHKMCINWRFSTFSVENFRKKYLNYL